MEFSSIKGCCQLQNLGILFATTVTVTSALIYIPCDLPLPIAKRFSASCHIESVHKRILCDLEVVLTERSRKEILAYADSLAPFSEGPFDVSFLFLRNFGIPQRTQKLVNFLSANFTVGDKLQAFQVCETIAQALQNEVFASGGQNIEILSSKPSGEWSKDELLNYISMFSNVVRQRWHNADLCERNLLIVLISEHIIQSNNKILKILNQPIVTVAFGRFLELILHEDIKKSINNNLSQIGHNMRYSQVVSGILEKTAEGIQLWEYEEWLQIQHSIPAWAICSFFACILIVIVLLFLNWYLVVRFNLQAKTRSGTVRKVKSRVLLLTNFNRKE